MDQPSPPHSTSYKRVPDTMPRHRCTASKRQHHYLLHTVAGQGEQQWCRSEVH